MLVSFVPDIPCVSPYEGALAATANTLDFADHAKQIAVKVLPLLVKFIHCLMLLRL